MITDEQRAVVVASIDARQVVLAGAGTGKTHVLVERIRYLLDSAADMAGYELLVLTFSRAVVAELKSRITEAGTTTRVVLPMTFDSFSTRLLASLAGDAVSADWREQGYDGRIAAADHALRTHGDVQATIGEYRHVFVDEIQDLVGVRASLVAAVLDHCQGFTLLGDPAQAIYDHQVRDTSYATSSTAFLKDVLRHHPDTRVSVMTTNFRAIAGQAACAEEVGTLLRRIDPDTGAVRNRLAQVIRDLDEIGTCADLATAIRTTRRRVAVLCRNNATAMRVSRVLYESGVDHRLQRQATDRVLPPWLAELFTRTDRSSWSRSNLDQLIGQRAAEATTMPTADVVWDLLAETVSSDTVVDLSVLRDRCRLGYVPDALAAQPDAAVVVSTIHRCKGLEFDDVFLAQPDRDVEDIDDAEELRVLYVALSRAREDVWTFEGPPAAPVMQVPAVGNRWIRSAWNARWKTLGFEVRASDIMHVRPFGEGTITADTVDTQTYLSHQIQRGDPIELVLEHVSQGTEPVPIYGVRHRDRLTGETDDAFGELLRRRLSSPNRRSPRWPPRLDALFCDGVETVVGLASEGDAAGLGTTGLWLRPRVVGLADVEWLDPAREDA